MNKPRIYIGGPHVFFPKEDQVELYNHIYALETKHNFEAIIPKDGDVEPISVASALDGGTGSLSIFAKNIEHMLSCDIIVADITPFRGVSMDVGTAYEIGFFAGLEKTISLWSHAHETTYKQRAQQYKSDVFCDYYGFPWLKCSEEDFGLTENLMITPYKGVKVSPTIEHAIKEGIMFWKYKQGE